MFYVAQSVCSDYTLASILSIIKRVLDLIQLVVPIILILSGSIQLTKMVLSPPEGGNNKANKKFLNSFLAAGIIFFLPLIIDITMSVINTGADFGIAKDGTVTNFELSSCWAAVTEKQNEMDSANDSKSSTIKDEAKEKLTTIK